MCVLRTVLRHSCRSLLVRVGQEMAGSPLPTLSTIGVHSASNGRLQVETGHTRVNFCETRKITRVQRYQEDLARHLQTPKQFH